MTQSIADALLAGWEEAARRATNADRCCNASDPPPGEGRFRFVGPRHMLAEEAWTDAEFYSEARPMVLRLIAEVRRLGGGNDTDPADDRQEVADRLMAELDRETLRSAQYERTFRTIRRMFQLPETSPDAGRDLLDKLQDCVATREAIAIHHAQKADDRCIEDDDRLYATVGLPPCDRRVGSKEEMLANCARFIDRRCEGGGWPSYRELETERDSLRARVANLESALQPLAALAIPFEDDDSDDIWLTQIYAGMGGLKLAHARRAREVLDADT